MQNKKEIADSIFTSIDVIVDRKLESLAFNKTIVGEIASVKDYYEVRYQDQLIKAQAINGAQYKIKDRVFVLIPNNGTRYNGFILGAYAASITSDTLEKEIAILRQQQTILLNALSQALNGETDKALQTLQEIGGE